MEEQKLNWEGGGGEWKVEASMGLWKHVPV